MMPAVSVNGPQRKTKDWCEYYVAVLFVSNHTIQNDYMIALHYLPLAAAFLIIRKI